MFYDRPSCPECTKLGHDRDCPPPTELRRIDPAFHRVFRCRQCGHIWSPAVREPAEVKA